MLTVYGIPNCDSCRKARKWLDAQEIEYRFHDVRADGLQASHVKRWLRSVPWNQLLNSRSTTWRQLTPELRTDINEDSVVALLVQYPTLIKRPVLDDRKSVLIGFSADQYNKKLG